MRAGCRITMSAMTQTVLLAIDTSTEFCSVALLAADGPTADAASFRTWVRHERTGAVSSTRVLPAVREVLDEAGLAFADCNAIAFGAGPGSFTGLRTATGVAQGLAFGRALPVVPVGTLLACAEAARLNAGAAAGRATRVLAALDARMDEVYWADYAWDDAAGDWQALVPASLAAPADVRAPDAPFVLAGNAAAAFGERLPACARAAGDRRERAAACAADRARRAARISRGTRRAGRSRGARVRARQGRADHRRAARRARGRRRPMSGVLMTDRYLAPMTDADLDEVVEIERAAYEFPWSRGNFEDSLRNGYFGVCMRHVTGVLVGYCVLMPVVDEMHLLNLCVAPVAQRSGVGLALLREAVRIARAERLDGVLLEVRPSNPRAIRLYERFGFVSVGRRRNYYPAKHRSREDAIVMRLALTKEGGAHGMD